MTLFRTIKMLEEEYKNAKQCDRIKNPLAYALYQVWKKADGDKGKEEK